MKKLLVLVMVLAMASMAAAAISIDMEINGVAGDTTNVAAGDVVTINFIDNDTDGANNELLGNGGFAALKVAVSSGIYGATTFQMDSQMTGEAAWDASFQPVANVAAVGEGFVVTLSGIYNNDVTFMGNTYIMAPVEGVVASFTFTAVANGTVEVADGLFNGIGDLGVLNVVVPEPITVALLGLGGLFIRRRK